jgi:hypothetical protein
MVPGETLIFEKRYKKYIDTNPILRERIDREVNMYCTLTGAYDIQKWIIETPENIYCNQNTYRLQLSIDTNLSLYASSILRATLSDLKKKNVTNGSIYIYDPHNKKVITYI